MARLLKRRRAIPLTHAVTRPSLIAAVGDAALAERIEVRLSAKARRVSLRVDPSAGQVVLVHPPRMSSRAVLAFTAAKRDWIAAHLAKLPPRIVFDDGVTIPVRGEPCLVRFAPHLRGGVWREKDRIVVSGRVEHAPRRLTDWLKAEARRVIAPLAREMGECLERKVAAVTVRDTTSRWGSCTRTGRLSFSWRLILAPEPVLTYVVAHEVAHLKYMDHSPAFWRTVKWLLPDGGMDSAREWLRSHGAVLHCYG